MGELTPVLLWPALSATRRAKPKVTSVALASMSAYHILYLAKLRTASIAPTLSDIDKQLTAISAAEEDILRKCGSAIRDTLIALQNALPMHANTAAITKAAKTLFTHRNIGQHLCD